MSFTEDQKQRQDVLTKSDVETIVRQELNHFWHTRLISAIDQIKEEIKEICPPNGPSTDTPPHESHE